MAGNDAVLDSVLDAVGGTPMVRLSRIGRDLPFELLGKLEFMNPGGSVKDRIGVRMLLEAERRGEIRPGDTLIEPTSGNTGIGLAMAAAVRGYRMIIVMPEKMSREKQVVLEALGAEIIRTPTAAAFDSPESHISVARHLQEVVPSAHILDQYGNEDNPKAHEETTAREILEQTGGRIHALVAGAGTGGTLTGIARVLKREAPECRIVGVDPEGSILAGPSDVKPYKVEGIGYDFIPEVLDRSVVDRWIKTRDVDAFRVARQLIRQEGLLVGGSCGSAVWAAMQLADELPEGARVVVLLPDSVRNYMTKFVDDAWMRQNGFLDQNHNLGTIAEIVRSLPPKEVITIEDDKSLGYAVKVLKAHGISQMPCVAEGRLSGIVTEGDLLHFLVDGRDIETPLAEVMERRVHTVRPHDDAVVLPELFERGEVAIVVDDERRVTSVLTKMDFIEFMSKSRKLSGALSTTGAA
ncbi:MAG: cystathionine beta-synthase [Sandaracinaceae bacterium]